MSIEQFGDMRTEYSKSLISVGEHDPNVVVLGADTTDSLKTAGFTYAIFLPGRCVDQIRNAIAYPSPGDKKGLNVKLVVSHGGLTVGADGGSHQQIEDIAIMRVIPNMKVLLPADSVAVSKLTWVIAQQYGPYYMRMCRSKTPIIHSDSQEFQVGKAITMREGSDCTITACGITVKMALDAANLLNQDGISCRVIDCFSIKPIDKELLEKAARETGAIVTCEEHNIMGGFGSAVSEVISESYPVPIRRIGVQDKFGESARDNEIPQLLEKHGLTPINIVNMVKEARNQKQ